MTKTWMAGVLTGAALISAAHASVAQDKGKSEAAKLTSESQAALQQLYATVPLAKALGPKARAILVTVRCDKLDSASSMNARREAASDRKSVV